jgi:hypothetical protein
MKQKTSQFIKKMPSIKLTIKVLVSGFLVMLFACNSQTGPGPEIHDTKYIALDTSDNQLEVGQTGPCVLDQFTGLVWEVKTDQPGLNNRLNTYTWFNPDEAVNEELDYRGKPDGGDCAGSACDTASLVKAVNTAAYCGYSDWRMPTRDELGSISDPRKSSKPPSINSTYFPHTQAGEYWSGNDYQFHWNSAWLWSFGNGLDRVEWKYSPRYVRLVRGQPVYLERVED